jgi:hypothetical protein
LRDHLLGDQPVGERGIEGDRLAREHQPLEERAERAQLVGRVHHRHLGQDERVPLAAGADQVGVARGAAQRLTVDRDPAEPAVGRPVPGRADLLLPGAQHPLQADHVHPLLWAPQGRLAGRAGPRAAQAPPAGAPNGG